MRNLFTALETTHLPAGRRHQSSSVIHNNTLDWCIMGNFSVLTAHGSLPELDFAIHGGSANETTGCTGDRSDWLCVTSQCPQGLSLKGEPELGQAIIRAWCHGDLSDLDPSLLNLLGAVFGMPLIFFHLLSPVFIFIHFHGNCWESITWSGFVFGLNDESQVLRIPESSWNWTRISTALTLWEWPWRVVISVPLWDQTLTVPSLELDTMHPYCKKTEQVSKRAERGDHKEGHNQEVPTW